MAVVHTFFADINVSIAQGYDWAPSFRRVRPWLRLIPLSRFQHSQLAPGCTQVAHGPWAHLALASDMLGLAHHVLVTRKLDPRGSDGFTIHVLKSILTISQVQILQFKVCGKVGIFMWCCFEGVLFNYIWLYSDLDLWFFDPKLFTSPFTDFPQESDSNKVLLWKMITLTNILAHRKFK